MNSAADAEYLKTWTRSLSSEPSWEPWHGDVLQAQFIDGEATKIRRNFIRRHTGLSLDGITDATRRRIVDKAIEILRQHGREPNLSGWRRLWLAA